MKVTQIMATLALSFLILAAAPFSANKTIDLDAGSKNINKNFAVKSGQKLVLDLEIGADIKIEGWDKEEVSIEARLKGDVDEIEVDFKESSDGLTVHAEYNGWSDNNNTGGVFNVKVPAKFDVKLVTMGGDVRLSGIEGTFSGQTMGGDILLTKLKGELGLTTMGGDIELTDSDVDGRVKTMGGDVDVVNVIGNVNASSMGGNIRQKNVRRRSGKSVGEEVHISTMGGDIDVDDAPFGAKVNTMGGDIEVNNAEKYVNAKTMGGDVVIHSIDGWVKVVTMGGDINVKVTSEPQADDKDVTLSSMNGDIKLYVPEGFSMDLDFDIMFDKEHEDEVEIISDFDVDEKVSEEWGYENGDERKHLYGKGVLNGGKNRLKISTINGKIYLMKS